MGSKKNSINLTILVVLGLVFALGPIGVSAKFGNPTLVDQPVSSEEVPSPHYDSILYSEIGPKLQALEKSSSRLKVEILGQSAGNRDLYLVTLSDPKAMGRLGRYQAIRRLMLTDPAAAQELLEKFEDFKVPVFINASIHGDEYYGVDAAIRLIETLALQDSPEIQSILESVILLVNVVANPDGRVLGTRLNANGFDLNRDFITQSQPETRSMARLISAWNPMVVLDLHGFISPMLIEPCTPLHNPNYEYDLYIKWAYYEAEAMEAELLAQTGLKAQIPFRDDALGWDDWPPTYTPMYAMFHGAYGHTLEAPYQDERGVDAHFAAVWGALKFIAANRQAMLYDQIEIFRRGFLDLPQMLIPDKLLNETQYDQYNDLMIKEFPVAYIIPFGSPFQPSDHQAARLVNFLLDNDIQVEKALNPFQFEGFEYPADTYIVWMNQPKRGLANTILESGIDLSGLEGISFYSPPSVWSNLLLWGVHGVVVNEKLAVSSIPIYAATTPKGEIVGGTGKAYAFLPDNLNAFKAANVVLGDGQPLYRAREAFSNGDMIFGSGTFLITNTILAQRLAGEFGLQFFAMPGLPLDISQMHAPRIAVSGDEGITHAIRSLGFSFKVLGPGEFNTTSILGYDLFINSATGYHNLSQSARQDFSTFILGGGDYIGLGPVGTNFVLQAGLMNLTAESASGNAIVRLEIQSDSSIGAGYFSTDFAFVNTPVWYSAPGDGVEVIAQYFPGEFLVSGFWPGWQISGAAGKAAVVHRTTGASDFTLFGIDATFRGHPENLFRMLGNAIFSGLD